MSSSTGLARPLPPSADYDDQVLYGTRREATKLQELIKLGNSSECVIYAIGIPVNKQQWTHKHLIRADKRIESMLDGMKVASALPVQAFSWPHLHRATFPLVCVAPSSTGKTYAHLIYMVAQSISAIPISKTDAIISATDNLSTFKIDQGGPSRVALDSSSVNGTSTANIDQDNFDFNSLGREESATKQPTNTAEANTDATQQQQQSNGWGIYDRCDVDPNNYIAHPSYIIICSSQAHVEDLLKTIDSMKLEAYGPKATEARRSNLPPIVKTVNVHQDDEKLALRCNGTEILIGTPPALIKCFNLEYLNFSMCKMVIFDDIDVALQLQNNKVRDLVKLYLLHTQTTPVQANDEGGDGPTTGDCQIFLFSRKWTELVKQFSHSVLPQRTIIFGSISEASLYADLRYEIEIYDGVASKLEKLAELTRLQSNGQLGHEKIVIVFKTDQEAEKVAKILAELEISVKHLPEKNAVQAYQARTPVYQGRNTDKPPVYVMSDGALEFIVDHLNNVTHLIHFSLPDDMLVFDQRFRLMYRHIQDERKGVMTTIFIGNKVVAKHAKELYDTLTRSGATLTSTKLALRDYISDKCDTICWRWAATGLCRLEKLSQNDRFGSYCPNKHSISKPSGSVSRWPQGGQVKITITHLVSPNECYFWFEAHRDRNSVGKGWSKLESTGTEYMQKIQNKLNKLKNSPSCSVPLNKFNKSQVYGVYLQQEARVDRIVILDDVVFDAAQNGSKKNGMLMQLSRIHYQLEYSRQVDVFKIDYGVMLRVYLRNIFQLPSELASLEPQCHRGFLMGVRPIDNEPNWLYKAKKFFHDHLSVSNICETSAWLRLNSNGCFWLENLVILRKMTSESAGDRFLKSEPHKELCEAQLADYCPKSTKWPSCLRPSEREETQCKWQTDKLARSARFASLRSDKPQVTLMVLLVHDNLDLVVRQADFNKQLIRLEDEIMNDFESNALSPLRHFEVGVYCLAKVETSVSTQDNQPTYTINRCRIAKLCPNDGELKLMIECLDHGDEFMVSSSDLLQIKQKHLELLPFQAMKCRIAGLRQEILEDQILVHKVMRILYSHTRNDDDQLVTLKCLLEQQDEIYLFVKGKDGKYTNLASLMSSEHSVALCKDGYPDELLVDDEDPLLEEANNEVTPGEAAVMDLTYQIITDIVKDELKKKGIEVREDEKREFDMNSIMDSLSIS